ncbi:hypothetical protein [Flavihumibacter petaseus]|uniref:Uncharacterized protein n=1 Tax=Flavihumibacter petaseus NBRC 106054 TaxID=1220578 RepID=A0A0E9N462_9BACT|nr:hypothetical protein [Flavihumibacter petaseus]GAO44155.1 hypothetical protein FPE01S_03_01930 [Flavihumibacter petaseus NBRC 106054]
MRDVTGAPSAIETGKVNAFAAAETTGTEAALSSDKCSAGKTRTTGEPEPSASRSDEADDTGEPKAGAPNAETPTPLQRKAA